MIEAKQKADSFIKLIEDVCLQVEIAGSLRRKKRVVKDIEIVALSKTKDKKDLFDNVTDTVSLLENRVSTLLADCKDLSFDPDLKRNGPKYKRLLWQGIKVDLFITVHSREWGALLAIRTGPWEFSKLLVTKQQFDGAMPNDYRQQDNQIWTPCGPADTSNEEKYFQILGLPCWFPWERSVSKLRTFLRKRIEMTPSG